jgi:hypothetical protein
MTLGEARALLLNELTLFDMIIHFFFSDTCFLHVVLALIG